MINTSNKSACESCKVRRERKREREGGGGETVFDPVYHSFAPHTLTLIFPRMPHYTTTHRASPLVSH